MKRIDAHMHFAGDHDACVAVLDEWNIKAMNICLAYRAGGWDDQKQTYRGMASRWPNRYAWCTTFDPPDYATTDAAYQERVIDGLAQDLRDGAVAVKIWKNIGMEFKKPSGDYLMVDDPIFAPIFEELRKREVPILLHIGEPLEWWKPLDPKSPHYDYITELHPEWYCYPKKDFPSHQTLVNARDSVLRRYPGIRFVGAHLGSLEYDLSVLARTLDEFPNFMVDTSARIEDLGVLHSPDNVRDFFLRYQHRVIYGSDQMVEFPQSRSSQEIRSKNASELRQAYVDHFRYLTTTDRFRFLGKDIVGVGLPEAPFHSIVYQNAASWYGL